MLSPSFILALTLSTLYGLVFYLVFGHGWFRLALYWILGVCGFFLGEWIAHAVGLALFNIGQMNLVEGTLVSWFGLFAARAWRR